MRTAAFALLVWAALDLPSWGIDRAGVALLAAAIATLMIGRTPRAPKPGRQQAPDLAAEPDEPQTLTHEALERLLAASTRAR